MSNDLTAAAAALALALLGAVSMSANAAGDPERGKAKAVVCAACHGIDGNSTNPAWPKIAGQHPSYFIRQVKAVRSGEGRGPASAVMTPMVANLSDQDIEDLAAYYAVQSLVPGETAPESVELGRKLFRGGNSETGLPACLSCHGPAGGGNGPAAFPVIAGQHPAYTAAQLQAYRDGIRTTDPNAMMRTVAKRLSDDEIAAISQYLYGMR